MKIKISERNGIKRGDHYSADILELPGSPTLGFGVTKEEAVAHIFQHALMSDAYRPILLQLIQTPIEFEYENKGATNG